MPAPQLIQSSTKSKLPSLLGRVAAGNTYTIKPGTSQLFTIQIRLDNQQLVEHLADLLQGSSIREPFRFDGHVMVNNQIIPIRKEIAILR